MQIQKNISLAAYNTFGINVTAQSFCVVKSLEDIQYLISNILPAYQKYLIIGGGSNVLFCNNFDGLIIKNELSGIECIKEDAQHVWIKSYAGTVWHQLVQYCVQHNYGGIENLSLIPGTVGAAPMQNIGAYGEEIKNVFYELTAIHLTTGNQVQFYNNDCHFGYRESIFKKEEKGKYFIYSVTLKLTKQPKINTTYGDIQKILAQKNITHPSINDVSEAVIDIRKSKLPDPLILGNAGSFFKNPEISITQASKLIKEYPNMPQYKLPNGNIKIPAGWLIEQAGWKGKRIGNTGNHAQQALVIVNYGNATGNEIWEHAQQVQQSVFEKFDILIDPEVNIIK